MKKRKVSKLSLYLVFSFAHIDIMTIVILILSSIYPETDYTQYYITFCGIYGAIEIIGCVILKALNIKNENNCC